ncbi:MAG: zf-TFIIB domain-containing protein [Candidatus Aureabacteria bacterium]|nr:zf-TFIIB domain-containing protein [Candidatus Auribacterota bacterium]
MTMKPSQKEEEYFIKLEFEKKKKLEAEKNKRIMEEEKKRLRDLHHMRCPKCGMTLVEIDHMSVKVDRCASCDGIWLDAKELETIIQLNQPNLKRWLKLF